MAAMYLKDRYPGVKYVAVVGTESLVREIQKTGVNVLHIDHVD